MSDIHGQHTAARALLEYAHVELPKDSLRFLGDYIDRGPKSFECTRLIQKYQRQGAVALIGNHEQMFMAWMAGRLDSHVYLADMNGGEATLKSFANAKVTQEDLEQTLYWMSQLKLTDEDDEYFYVHAGIHPHKSLPNQHHDDLLWIRGEFLTARPEWLTQQVNGKIIVHGHTAMKDVCFDGVKINIDIGAGGRKKLALVELTSRTVYEYDFEQARLNGHAQAIREVPMKDASPVSLY